MRPITAELVAQMNAQPDDPAPYLVYADWLQQREDPRGELIAIQHRRERAPNDEALREAELALLDADGPDLLPPRLHAQMKLPRRQRDDARTRCQVEWSRGFLMSARIARRLTSATPADPLKVAGIVEELLAHPSARLLRRLAIGGLGTPDEYNYIDVIDAIARRGHAQLAELVLGDFGPEMALAFSRAGNVVPLFAALPALRRLTVHAGSLRFESPIEHARLRELSMIVATITPTNVSRLLRAQLPALESLELSCPGLELTDHEFGAMLSGASMPRLRRLALRNTVGTLRVLEEIAHSHLMPQLEVLELDGGDLDDRGAASLVAHRAARFAHLQRLELSGNRLSADGAARLAGLCADVRAVPGARGVLEEIAVIARAPDARSVAAARAIARPERWLALGRDQRRVWGKYDDHDGYQVWARLDRDGAPGACTCRSTKVPCKHVLALLLLAASPHPFAERPMPASYDAVPRVANAPRTW